MQFKQAVDVVRWGPRRKKYVVSGGKGDCAANRLEGKNCVVFGGSELQLREGH